MKNRTEITYSEILSLGEYEKIRNVRKSEIVTLKKRRRLQIGPHATCNFECYDTIWWQIHEMLRIEKGGEEQTSDELQAYNPLVPNGSELVATIMFEIVDVVQRHAVLAQLGGIEETMFLRLADDIITGVSEADVDRTSSSGKASSVQFIHFPFTRQQVNTFCSPKTTVTVGFNHLNYGHMAILPDAMRSELASDFG